LFFGVVSGLAEHFAISTLLLRIIVVAISILLTFWPVVIIYLIMVFIMPPESAYRR
jgi:phage shock protein PspC (stress-responsive transcriptional regulator)